MQGIAPKILFMTGFLINSTAMSGLFFLLNYEWDSKRKTQNNTCLSIADLYESSIGKFL